MALRFMWTALGLAVLVPFVAVAQTTDASGLLEVEHKLSVALRTPHTAWARPHPDGPVRTVFFAPWYQNGTECRESVELMQRFDLDAQAVYFLPGPKRLLGDGNPRWYGDVEAGTNRALRLLDDSPGVLFLNHVSLDALPDAVRSKLRQAVTNGAGLVVVGEDVGPPFDDAKPATPEPALDGSSGAFTMGNGRITLLPPRPKLEFALGWETELDYQMARQGRALLWAAKRTPRARLEVRVPREMARTQLDGEQVTVSWDKALPRANVRVALRRWDGHTTALGSVPANRRREAAFTLPSLRAGAYHVDAFAVDPKGVENWVSGEFTVTSPRWVEAVTLKRDWAEVGDTLAGEVALAGAMGHGDSVRVRLMDTRGRILAQSGAGAESNAPIPFTFKVEPWMPMLLRVEAALLDGADEAAAAHAFCRVTKRHQNQFNFVIWNIPSGDLAPYGVESLARNGATAILQGGDPTLAMSASGLPFVPYATSFRKSSHTVTAMLDPDGVMKGGCLYDEATMKEWVDSTVERHEASRGHGVLVYSLGDENAVRGSCLSPHCLKAYQRYLAEVYGSIAALNEEWGSNYTAFEDVALLGQGDLPAADAPKWFKEYFAQRLQKNRTDSEGGGEEQIVFGDINDEMRALQAENYARWYDRQAFQNHTYVEWCKRFKDAFRQLDPKSLTGFEGTDSFSMRRLTTRSRQGGDLDRFVRELEYFGPYGGPANEVVRSIAPPTFPMGNWIGYTMEADVLLERYWDQITNCMNTVQWWRWDNLDGYHGYLNPCLDPFPATQELLDDTRIVRDGLGDLLMRCQMHDDGVAMLYSMPSTHIAHFDGNRTYGNYKRDHKLWHEALHESGVQFRYVTDRMLRLGEFDAKKFKVLILPLAFAIDPQEADVIREFVRQGGTLIADVRPGIYDGHCKPREHGILDDVFGIERTGKQDAVALDRMDVNGEIGSQPVSMRWGNWEGREIYPQMKVDPTVAVTTGKELGKAFPIHFWGGLNHPVCIVSEFGEGRAVLLNFPIYDAPAQPLVEGILASAGVQPKVTLDAPGGGEVHGVEITRWQNGGIELMALLGTYDGDVVVELPETTQVYDMKARKAFGKVSEFTTPLRPHRAAFFALLPEQPSKPDVTLDTKSVSCGSVVTARISVPTAAGTHAVRLSVTKPDGEPAPWLTQTLLVDDEAQDLPLAFAFNDPEGKWTVRAVDLLTGQDMSTSVKVKHAE
jgi:Beta-galactosidase trimerisation domain/Beta-galactosidase